MRRFALVVVIIAAVAAVIAGTPADHPAIVESATVDGIIHPVTSEFMRKAIAKADAEGARLIVFTLRTPGGLLDSTRDINNAIIAARTPVAIFVGPSGNRAASAGFLITMAADIAAMAPGTHIGAAHPVAGNGEKMDDVMAKKAASDTAAYARTLAAQRGRNVTLVEQAVIDSRSFTEQEALQASPPLIDIVATDVADLVKKLDGRTVKRFNGATTTLALAGAETRTIEMTWSAANPDGRRASTDRLPPADAWDAGPDDRAVESGGDPSWRSRRALPAPGVFRAAGAPGQLRGRAVDRLWLRAPGAGSEDNQPRSAGGRRDYQPVVWIADADRLPLAGDADRTADDPPDYAVAGGNHPVPRPAGSEGATSASRHWGERDAAVHG